MILYFLARNENETGIARRDYKFDIMRYHERDVPVRNMSIMVWSW
jgi:hypothetical protein